MTISPPEQPQRMRLYEAVSTKNMPPCSREESPFGWHDDWPEDMKSDEFIVIELSDGSSRVARNKAAHIMMMFQLSKVAEARPTVTFKRFRCRLTRILT